MVIERILKDFVESNKIITEKDLLNMLSKSYAQNYRNKQTAIKNIINKDLNFIENNNKTFFYQLYGTQRPPDFVIVEEGKILNLEAKSSKTNQPQFNSHIPDQNTIFLISIKSGNFVTMGRDLISSNKAQQIKQIYGEISNEINKKWEDRLGVMEYWDADYIRRMGKFKYKALEKNKNYLYESVLIYLGED